MPWKVTCVMEERLKFIAKWLEQEWSMAALCREFGISRKAGYRLLARYREEGQAGLRDRSRAPRHHPHAPSEEQAAGILEARRQHPTWGPRKLHAWLKRKHPRMAWPCPSTMGALLHREGLTVPRRRRRRTPPYTQPFAAADRPNAVWCADFKGWFRTQDGLPCYPFTLSDAHTRFLLRCQALARTDSETVQPLLEAAFREYGLPQAIRTDNGPPFASSGLAGLSRLSIWWVKLGIVPERIAAGCPEQNGRHERMHRTLEEAIRPPQANRRSQQRAFDRYRPVFNTERPHEALGQATPDSCYLPSERTYPLRLPELEYPAPAQVRRVRHSGEIRWRCGFVYVSQPLAGELVALLPLDERYWRLCFGPLQLALLDDHTHRLIIPKTQRNRRSKAGIITPNVLPMCSV
jgi:putative transposase